MSLAVFLATLGATARLTRLGIEDTITQPFRDFLARRSARSKVAFWFVQLFECPWCLGMWIAMAMTAAAVASDGAGWYLWPATALSISYLIGVAATVLLTIEEMGS